MKSNGTRKRRSFREGRENMNEWIEKGRGYGEKEFEKERNKWESDKRDGG